MFQDSGPLDPLQLLPVPLSPRFIGFLNTPRTWLQCAWTLFWWSTPRYLPSPGRSFRAQLFSKHAWKRK